MTLSVDTLTIDCHDPKLLADFWCAALGYRLDEIDEETQARGKAIYDKLATWAPGKAKDKLAQLTGGPERLAARAQELSEAGDHRLACQLIELAARAGQDPGLWHLRADLYRARALTETSLMAKGIFGFAANESKAKSEG